MDSLCRRHTTPQEIQIYDLKYIKLQFQNHHLVTPTLDIRAVFPM